MSIPAPAVLWPTLLGLCVLAIGLVTYRRDYRVATSRGRLGLVAFGPVFIAAALAAFAGEHFTAAPSLAQIVPKWLPAPLLIAYFVGVAHLAAAVSFVAKRYVRWSAMWLAIMFALFVLTMDLPGAIAHPAIRMGWSLAAREATFSLGALALFAIVTGRAKTIAPVVRLWTAGVLVFYGLENILFPQFAPGVPDLSPTASWVPMPTVVAYVTGIVLVACGIAMFGIRSARAGAAACGSFMLALTLALYVPQYFIAAGVSPRVTAINFIFDTLLFAGTMLVISSAIDESRSGLVAERDAAAAQIVRRDGDRDEITREDANAKFPHLAGRGRE